MTMLYTSVTRLCLRLPKKTCFPRWGCDRTVSTKFGSRKQWNGAAARESTSMVGTTAETAPGSVNSALPQQGLYPPSSLSKSRPTGVLPVRSVPITCAVTETSLVIQDFSGRTDVPFVWLRDNCSCDKCFNKSSYQRNSWTLSTDVAARKVVISNGYIHTTWTDGHESHHELGRTKMFFHFQNERIHHPDRLMKKELWDNRTWENLEPNIVTHDEVSTESGLGQLLTNIQRFGFGLVNGCDQTEIATEALIKRVGPPMPTTFSPGMWTFTSNMERGDTAYSSCYLAPHTDTTYFSNPARIQVFHCLERDGCVGGENLLVDGFACAEKLQTSDLAAFGTLASVPQECVYREPGVCYKWTDTIFRSEAGSTALKQVRFNMYDRSETPPLCSPKQLPGFYKALKQYADLTQSEQSQFRLQLVPGLVIFIDNWRVLHGRTSFLGKRVLTGCYMSNDEYEHACRKLSLV